MRIIIARNFWNRFRGLMFRRDKKIAIVFPLKRSTRLGASIHSWFVFFPFDLIYLDESGRVVEKHGVKPFTPRITPKTPVKYIIEVPEGMGDYFRLGERIKLPKLTKEIQKRYKLFTKEQNTDARRMEGNRTSRKTSNRRRIQRNN